MADTATLALDHTTLGVSDVRTAHDFYTAVFSSAPVAELAADVGAESAVRGGARMLKPAKKGFFGGFSTVFEAPDGTI
ncbi:MULTISPECIES: hypothetical protein [Mumia]|uniref:hypothetical protein n=1 Tax=Mumia TaxID=1546255 RepID=UPI001422142F|nr:hypothetical protein [Mumia sp. ZJ1417]QMW68153.1 hypothetical protein H4N58_10085 [Mumia sp. ZJ1417]